MRWIVLLFLSTAFTFGQTQKYQNPLLPFIFFNSIEMYEQAAAPLVTADSSYVFSEFNINQIYLETKGSKTVSDYGYWNFTSGINSSLLIVGQKYFLHYSFEKNKKFLLSKQDSDQLQYKREYTADKFFLKTPQFWNTISFNSTLRKKNRADLEYRLGFSLLALDNLIIDYGYRYFNNDWKMQWSNANGDIDILFKEDKIGHDIQALWTMKNIKLSTKYTRVSVNKESAIKNGELAMPLGDERLIKLGAIINDLWQLNEWNFSYINFHSDLKGSFYSDKEKFGELTRKESSYQEYSLALSKSFNRHKVVAKIAAGETEFAVNGNMDTGPFTDFWLGFLGLRNLIISKFDYRHINSRLAYTYRMSPKAVWDFSIAHEYLTTNDNSFLRTWQAEIIIPRNIRFFDLGAEEQNGFYIDSQISYKIFSNISVRYEVSQYIPIDTGDRAKRSSKSKNKNFVYGGGQHLVRLHIAL